MIIDRERVKNTFAEYTSGYNATDPKIKLKIDHTYRVAELCELIARDLKLDEYETDVAWLTGMLHDVGRFEQIKRYNTFNDAQSVDHANFGADLLFKEGLIDTYVDGFHDDKYGTIVENAIRNHSAFRIDERLDDYTVMFCNILRDADKVDIFRVNVDTPAEDIYNVTTEELKNPQDLTRSRIYDRVLERCVPLRINNQNIRQRNAAESMKEARKILESGTGT